MPQLSLFPNSDKNDSAPPKHSTKPIDLTGKTFSQLTVIAFAGHRTGRRMWLCQCECGSETVVAGKLLRRGHTRSCGCLKRELARNRCHEKDSWTAEMKEELRQRYPTEGCRPFAEKYGLKAGQVVMKANSMGLKSLNYPQHKAKATRLSRQVLADKNDSVNWRYFETWSANMAWMLGYIWADGCVTPGTLRFQCSSADDGLLEQIKAELKAKHLLKKSIPSDPVQGYPSKPHSRLVICSKNLSQSLIRNHGVLPNKKSLDLPFPEIPDKYAGHFARGVLDGDGCVFLRRANGYPRINWCGPPRFISGLRASAIRLLGISTTKISLRKPTLAYVTWGSAADILKIYDWIYPEGEYIFLERKRSLLEESIKNICKVYWRRPNDLSAKTLTDLYATHGTWDRVAASLGASKSVMYLVRKEFGLIRNHILTS